MCDNSDSVSQNFDSNHALDSCWMEEVYSNWIYKGPCIFSVLINLIFLAVIVRKVISMLHSDVSDRKATIKTAKAIGEISHTQ